MKEAGFSDKEFELLKQAQANSDGLVRTEIEAMNAVKGIFKDEAGNYTIKKKPDQAYARAIMHDEKYHRYKAEIMRPIDEFFVTLDKRTSEDVSRNEDRSKYSLIISQILGFALIIATAVAGLFVANRVKIAVTTLGETSAFISSVGRELQGQANNLSGQASSLAASTEQSSASLEQMSGSIASNADNARDTEQIAISSSVNSEASQTSVNQTILAIRQNYGKRVRH